jgi:hypothetical protein
MVKQIYLFKFIDSISVNFILKRVGEIKRVVNDAIQNKKLIRMKYTRSLWDEKIVDEETGELILTHTEA